MVVVVVVVVVWHCVNMHVRVGRYRKSRINHCGNSQLLFVMYCTDDVQYAKKVRQFWQTVDLSLNKILDMYVLSGSGVSY